MTDPSGYAKTLALSAGFDAPRLLRYDDVTAHAITRDDLAADVRGINASLDLSARPAAARGRPVRSPRRRDYVDLVRHECEFPDGKSFTFCVEAEAAAISAAHTSSRVARSGLREILDAPPSDHEITCQADRAGRRPRNC